MAMLPQPGRGPLSAGGGILSPTQVAPEAQVGLQQQPQLDPNQNPLLATRTGTPAANAQPAQKAPSGGLMDGPAGTAISTGLSMASAASGMGMAGGLAASAGLAGGAAAMMGAGLGIAGTIVGAIAMDIFGGKQKDPVVVMATKGMNTGGDQFEDGYFVKSELGTIGLAGSSKRVKIGKSPQLRQAVESMAAFDNTMAKFLSQEGIDRIRGWTEQGWEGGPYSKNFAERYIWMLDAAKPVDPAAQNARDLIEDVNKERTNITQAFWKVHPDGMFHPNKGAEEDTRTEAEKQIDEATARRRASMPLGMQGEKEAVQDTSGGPAELPQWLRPPEPLSVLDQIKMGSDQPIPIDGEYDGFQQATTTGKQIKEDIFTKYKEEGGKFGREMFDKMFSSSLDGASQWDLKVLMPTILSGLAGYTIDDLGGSGVEPDSVDPARAVANVAVGEAQAKQETSAGFDIDGFRKYVRSKYGAGAGKATNESKPATAGKRAMKGGRTLRLDDESEPARGYFEKYVSRRANNIGGLK